MRICRVRVMIALTGVLITGALAVPIQAQVITAQDMAPGIAPIQSMIPGIAPIQAQAQGLDNPSPRQVFLRSLVVPGWGHLSLGDAHASRGRTHMITDAGLVLAMVIGEQRQARLLDDGFAVAETYAGISLTNKSRSLQLAVSDYDSFQEYNETMLRLRNWNRLLVDTPENHWTWASSERRVEYQELREQADQAGRAMPIAISLMVANRVVSALSAARVAREASPSVTVSLSPVYMQGAFQEGGQLSATVRF